jgi:hypothetical protein
VGTIFGTYPNLNQLQLERPSGPEGAYYLIGNDLNGFNPSTQRWFRIGPIGGPTGPSGPAGGLPTISVGTTGTWIIGGNDSGRPARGLPGDAGIVGTIVGSYPTPGALQLAQPNGPQGVYYLVGQDMYGYDPNTRQWFRIGPVGGPTGPTGPSGASPSMTVGPNGNWIINGQDRGSSAAGAKGPRGATGVIKGSYPSPNDLQNARPNGPPGDFFLVGNNLYSFDPGTNAWRNIGPINGPTGPAGNPGATPVVSVGPNGNFIVNGNEVNVSSKGPTGPAGPTGTFVGGYTNPAQLQAEHPTGRPGEFYLVNKRAFGFDPITNSWRDIGPLGGPTGPAGPTEGAGAMPPIAVGPNGNWTINGQDTGTPAKGATGEAGAVGTIVGSYPNPAALQAARPNGPAGVYYLVGRDLYGFDPNTRLWFRIGPIAGPTGPTGTGGKAPTIVPGTNGNWFINGVDSGKPAKGATGPKGPTGAILGSYQTPGELQSANPSGPPGSFYIIGPDLYSFDPGTNTWKDVGPVIGPTGPTGGAGGLIEVAIGPNGNFFANGLDTAMTSRGVTGAPGPTGTFVGGYPSPTALQAAHPTGAPGEFYLVNRRVYGFDPATNSWKDIGPLGGPTGPKGPDAGTGTMQGVTTGPSGTWVIGGNDTGVP